VVYYLYRIYAIYINTKAFVHY